MDEQHPLHAMPVTSPSLAVEPIAQQELAIDAYLRALLASVPEIAASASAAVGVGAAVETAPEEEGRALHLPEWARSEFQTLFFKVHGIVFATPLLAVRRVNEFTGRPCALPGRPSWLLGLWERQGETIGILHTAELAMGRERLGARDFDAQPYRQILVSRHGRYGFACDEVLDMGKLHPADVVWRNPESIVRRPWLMGMVPQRLCALVDLERLRPLRRRDESE